jgi:hypothetical protein
MGKGRRQPETHVVAVLDCQRCGELTPGARFRYTCERLVCDHCGAENPQAPVHSIQVRDILVRFVTRPGGKEAPCVQAMDLNLDPIGPVIPVARPETVRRLLAYLGALPVTLHDFDRSHGEGYVRLTTPARLQEFAASLRFVANE